MGRKRASRGTDTTRASRGTDATRVSRGPDATLVSRGLDATRASGGTDGISDSRGTDGVPDSRGTNGTRATRGRTPAKQSIRRTPHDSSPAQSDVGTLQKFTSAFGRVTYRGGHAGSSSRTGSGDPMGDMHGVIRQHLHSTTDRDDRAYRQESDDDTSDGEDADLGISQRDSTHEGRAARTSDRKTISRMGDKFGSREVHNSISRILKDHLEGPWNTFLKVPKSVLADMYKCFKTRWRWDLDSEHNTYDAFINVLKSRYPDIMSKYRTQSIDRAKKAGETTNKRDDRCMDIIRHHPPLGIADDVWHQLCDIWNTKEYREKCEIAAKNRASADASGKTSRHTAGSIGYDETRARLKIALGKEPSYKELFIYTHTSKETKAKLLAKELDISKLEEMEFCNDRAEKAYDDYLKECVEVHGSIDPDDSGMWRRLQPSTSKRRVFGIGSSDIDYVVTGTPSSSCGIVDSSVEQRKSQEKIRELEAQMVDERRERDEMRQQMEDERRERDEMRLQMEEQKLEMERQRKEIERQSEQHKRFEEFMKKYDK